MDKTTEIALQDFLRHTHNRPPRGWPILLGAGASKADGLPTMVELVQDVLDEIDPKSDEGKLISAVQDAAQAHHADIDTQWQVNVEDLLRELIQAQQIVEGKKNVQVQFGSVQVHDGGVVTKAIQAIKEVCRKAIQGKQSFENLATFLAYWLKPHNILDIFTTNWDNGVETACDQLNASGIFDLRCCDGFKGFDTKLLDLNLFRDEEKAAPASNHHRVNLYKLHGSVDWRQTNQPKPGRNVPVPVTVEDNDFTEEVMIYPTPRKHREILGSPYMDLLRMFSDRLSSPDTKYLLVIGSSLPDEHINSIVSAALRRPDFNLFVVDPALETSRVKKTLGDTPGVHAVLRFKLEDFTNALKNGGQP